MKSLLCTRVVVAGSIAAAVLLAACGGHEHDDSPTAAAPVVITSVGANAVSYWNEVATTTINQPAAAGGTPEEARPSYAADLATVQLAVYDAMMAIDKRFQPYAVVPAAPADGALPEATVAAAAYGVLKGLFPSRGAFYQAAYDTYLAGLTDGAAKTRGITLGSEVAVRMLALRANDGRSVAYPPFVNGTAPGQFRSATANPVGRENPYIRPSMLVGASQFRAPGPRALASAEYAADVNETKALGAATSTTRTAAQTEIARFHTEPPFSFWPRNMRAFATTSAGLADQARLMAMVWVTQADATIACFESKYFHLAWRPYTAINLDGDDNAATTVDPAWTPVVPTPNHPEYPAAHACVSGAMAELMRSYYGTSDVTFDFTSTVTGSTHHFTSPGGLYDEIVVARIAGGMHFRTAIADGQVLGRSVADWVIGHGFQKR